VLAGGNLSRRYCALNHQRSRCSTPQIVASSQNIAGVGRLWLFASIGPAYFYRVAAPQAESHAYNTLLMTLVVKNHYELWWSATVRECNQEITRQLHGSERLRLIRPPSVFLKPHIPTPLVVSSLKRSTWRAYI
jgi:hypothetical protein